MATNGLRVLAHVKDLPESTVKALAGTEPKVPGFPEWVDIEHPRHSFLTEDIAAATTEFGVADGQKVHRTFKKLTDALAARDGAKVTFGVDVVDVPATREARKAAKEQEAEQADEQESQERMHDEAEKATK